MPIRRDVLKSVCGVEAIANRALNTVLATLEAGHLTVG